MINDNIGVLGAAVMPFPRVLRKGELCFLSYKKEDFTSFEITSLDGERLINMLDTLLQHGAISEAQYQKSAGDLKKLMFPQGVPKR